MVLKNNKVALTLNSMTNNDGCGWMFTTPTFSVWYNNGTICISFTVLFWSIAVWVGDVENLI